MYNELGVGLKLEAAVMGRIVFDAKRCTTFESLVQVLTEWLRWNYPYETLGKPSLSLLMKAVGTYDAALAVKVFEKFTAAAGEHSVLTHIINSDNQYIFIFIDVN